MRIGMGYDVHRLVENRELILGGVTIDYELGLLGHSDADVLLHAIMDALLGTSDLTGSWLSGPVHERGGSISGYRGKWNYIRGKCHDQSQGGLGEDRWNRACG